MLYQRMIEVEPLSSEEAWSLFTENLGCDTTLPPSVEQIAKSITRECAGLPLEIKTMAGAMRGAVDVREWRNVLAELIESNDRQDDDMEPEILRLIGCLLDPGRQNLTRDMRYLITYLLNVCLLERARNSSDGYVRMHGLMTDVALQILQESSSITVKAGAQLRESWKVDRGSCQSFINEKPNRRHSF